MPLVCDDICYIKRVIFDSKAQQLYIAVFLFFSFAQGIVRTSVIVTGVQVCSRIFMVWFITNSIRQVTTSVSLLFASLNSK